MPGMKPKNHHVTVAANSSVSGDLGTQLIRDCASVEETYERGDKKAARLKLKQLRRKHADSPIFRSTAAMVAYLDGRYADAHRDILVAVEKQPENGYYWSSYGQVLRQLERFDEAEAAYWRAAELTPDNDENWNRLGIVLRYVGRSDEAIEALQKAIRLRPTNCAAIRNLSQCAGFIFDDQELGRIEEMARTIESDEDKIRCHHALYNSRLRMGDDTAAFADLKRSNDLHHKVYPPRDLLGPYGRYLTKHLTLSDLERRAEKRAGSPTPIFIVGMPRTGSTLAEQVLSAHPQVIGLGERTDVVKLFNDIGLGNSARPAPLMEIMKKLDRRVTGLGEYYIDARREETGGYTHFTDKALSNFTWIGFLKQLLPDAKFVHITRHPLDTIIACYETSFTSGHDYAYDLDTLTTHFLDYQKLMAHWHQLLPDDIFELRYEDLVTDTASTVEQCLDFIGLPMHEDCLLPEKNARVVTSASTEQVRQQINPRSVGRWQRFAQQLDPAVKRLTAAGAITSDTI